MRLTPKQKPIVLSKHFPLNDGRIGSGQADHSTFPLLPLLRYLRFFGGLPFKEKNAALTSSIVSWPMLYCVLVTVLQWILAQYTILNSQFYRGFGLGFDYFIRSFLALIYLGFVFLNLLFWFSAPAIVRAVNMWNHLQTRLDLVVGKSLKSSVLMDYPGCCLVVVIGVAFLETNFSFKATTEFRILVVFNFFLIMQNLMIFTWFWVVFPHIVSRKSESLKHSLMKTILLGGRGEDVRRHRALWEQLRAHTRVLTNAVAVPVNTWLLLRMLLIVLSFYASAVFMQGVRGTRLPAHTLIPLMRSVFDLAVACECSYLADLQMRQEFQVVILSCKFQSLSADTRDELELFLCSLERSGHIFNVQGVFELSRRTLLSVISLTLTYITILVQLKQHPLFKNT